MAEVRSMRKLETTVETNGGYYGAFQTSTLHNSMELEKSIQLSMTPPEGFLSQRIPLTVQWRNIEYAVGNDKTILKDLSGVVKTGELTAIMGPSGSGKSTLCNILSGFMRQKVSGQILLNGAECSVDLYRKLCCYIMQDDHLLPYLTVQEAIFFAASLKLPSDISRKMKQGIVKECMASLGLTECQNVRAINLSGGQRKRLCIAQELVSNPPLIFLDEPTSGLDISSCIQCIELLKSLARQGRTVVCTIHQPSSRIYNTFDKLYMLAEGRCIYRGKTEELISFLAEQGLQCPNYYNPADFVIEVASGKYGNWIEKLEKAINAKDNFENLFSKETEIKNWLESSLLKSNNFLTQDKTTKQLSLLMAKHIQSQKSGGYEISLSKQFRILVHRSFLCILREPMTAKLHFIAYLAVGILLGLLYFGIGNDATKLNENTGCLFFSLLYLLFAAMMPTLLIFPTEKEIFIREHLNGWYDAKIYYLARTLADIPFQILFPVIFSTIVYWMTSQPPDLFRYGLFLCSSVLVSMVAQSVGLIIGASTSVNNSVFMGPVVTIPLLMVCGFFIHLNAIPIYLRWFSYLSYIRYAFQGVLLIIFSMGRGNLDCDKEFCLNQNPVDHLKDMEMMDESLYFDYAIQGVLLFIYRLVAFLILWYRLIHIR